MLRITLFIAEIDYVSQLSLKRRIISSSGHFLPQYGVWRSRIQMFLILLIAKMPLLLPEINSTPKSSSEITV